jgi:hypothetical protein
VILLVLAAALAQAGTTQTPASPPGGTLPLPPADIVGHWDDERISGGFAQRIDSHLSEAERKTLREVEIRIRVGPAPANDQCRPLARFAYAEREGRHSRVNVCFRNVTLFSMFGGSMMMWSLISPAYHSEQDALDYARLVALAYARISNEPDFAVSAMPCLYPEFIILRRAGLGESKCFQGSLPRAEMEAWVANHRDMFDIAELGRQARALGQTPDQLLNTLGQGFAAELMAVYYYFILHEIGHFHLGHMTARMPPVCEQVRQEHAADQFARRLILIDGDARASAALAVAEMYWIIYQAGTHDFSGDTSAMGLDLVRLQTMVINFLDALPSLTPEQRALFEAGRRPSSPAFEEGRRQLTALRTCLTSNQPIPDRLPPARPGN